MGGDVVIQKNGRCPFQNKELGTNGELIPQHLGSCARWVRPLSCNPEYRDICQKTGECPRWAGYEGPLLKGFSN